MAGPARSATVEDPFTPLHYCRKKGCAGGAMGWGNVSWVR